MICIVNKTCYMRVMERKKVIFNVNSHNHICISSNLNMQYSVCSSFCITHYHHCPCQKLKLKGDLPGSLEKHNFNKPLVARTRLCACSGLGLFPRFQVTRLKFPGCQVTVFSFCSRNQAKAREQIIWQVKE